MVTKIIHTFNPTVAPIHTIRTDRGAFFTMLIGDIVTSKITGNKIKITKIKQNFIIGQLIGFIPSKSFHLKLDTGIRILSKQNIL